MVRVRKAQAGAAVLVVLIALLIILYVLFLPPDQRAILLGEDNAGPQPPGTQPPPTTSENILYSTQPQIITPRGPEERILPVFTIRTVTSGNILAERSGLTTERTVFHEDPQTMTFSLPENSENVFLSFIAREGQGDLRITLNGVAIYDAQVTQRQPAPIRLHPDLLQAHNELEFSVSGVGFRFWDSNRYALSDVRISADTVSLDVASQTQRVVVRELDSVDAAILSFTPDCEERAGRLTVRFNSQSVYSGVPDCGVPLPIEVGLSRLQEDENTLSWNVEQGQYTIYDASFTIHRTPQVALDSFIISQELFNRIHAEGLEIQVRLRFIEPGAQGTIRLNGEPLAFRTNRLSFTAPVTSYVRPGQNIITVVESSPDVASLEVLYG